MKHVFEQIEGSASVALQFDDLNNLVLATNTGSLYLCYSKSGQTLVFASEKYILEQTLNHKLLRKLFCNTSIIKVEAGQGYIIDPVENRNQMFLLNDSKVNVVTQTTLSSHFNIIELYDSKDPVSSSSNKHTLTEDVKESMLETWAALYSDENSLRRCSRCLLPETMPLIAFDEEGVCSYCRDYEQRGSFVKGEKELKAFVSDIHKKSFSRIRLYCWL